MVLGGFAGAMSGNILLTLADKLWLHPDSPDAGQFGVVGIPVGLLVGCGVAWILTGKKKSSKS
jgi:hypothetical protein